MQDFHDSFFSREIPPIDDGFSSIAERVSLPPKENEREKVDYRYQKFLHHQVVTTEEAKRVLDLASLQTEEHERAVVQLPCICRHTSYGGDKELRCFGLSFSLEYARKYPKFLGGSHQYISADEAKDLLDDMAVSGEIVHAVSAMGVPYIGMLCNCDMQVCQPYIYRQRLGINSPWYKGHFAAKVDESKCIGCGTCEDTCPFEVPTIDDAEQLAVINPENCHGCGVCTYQCEEHALSLVEYSRPSGY